MCHKIFRFVHRVCHFRLVLISHEYRSVFIAIFFKPFCPLPFARTSHFPTITHRALMHEASTTVCVISLKRKVMPRFKTHSQPLFYYSRFHASRKRKKTYSCSAIEFERRCKRPLDGFAIILWEGLKESK